MIRDRALHLREKRVGKLPVTGELLRGSLLERTIRHTKDCPKCARGEGHHVFVLTVTYPGGRRRSTHSGLILAARITLPHFSVSSPMNFPNWAGVIGIGAPPRSASRAVNWGSASAA